MGYVNKVRDKNGVEAEIHDFRDIKAEDGKLLIDEVVQPVGPTPIITIDGVAYYHKREFDLETILAGERNVKIDILTGEELDESADVPYLLKAWSGFEYVAFYNSKFYNQGPGFWDKLSKILYSTDDASAINYESRSFIVVNEISQDTSYEDAPNYIPLPGCSAYYGYLSEDHKTFISYWNEEGDGPAEVVPVTKIKDANNNEVEVHDARLSVSSADIGKLVGVDANGQLALVDAPQGGGTQLYQYQYTDSSNYISFSFISAEEIISLTQSYPTFGYKASGFGPNGSNRYIVLDVFVNTSGVNITYSNITDITTTTTLTVDLSSFTKTIL